MEETRPKRYTPALPSQEVIEASLPCDGRTLQSADWPELCRILGHVYGGDGSTFALPDLRPSCGYGPKYMIVARPIDVPGYKVGQQWWRE